MNIVIMGPIGSGKGTQSAIISKEYNIPHISTGDIFRYNIENNTELGKVVKSILAKGDLVSDELTISIVKDRLLKEDCQNGFILDGFPRNYEQAKALSEFATIDKVLMLEVSFETIYDRLKIRRICKSCGQPTNTNWLVDGKCEKCGGEVYAREDDQPEAIKNRLQKQAIQPEMVEYYNNQNVLHKFEFTCAPNEAFAEIDKALKAKV